MNIIYDILLSDFAVLGAGNFYTFDAGGQINSTTHHAQGELVKYYPIPKPRLAAMGNK